MLLFYMCLGALLRRMYGGWLESVPVLKERGVQTALMIITFLSIYITDIHSWQSWLYAGLISSWLQIQLWSRGHGATFYDMGRDKNPDVSRYDRWYTKVLNCFYDEDNRYKGSYDLWYHTMRYTCPTIPLMLIDWRYILIGLSSTVIYEGCIRMRENNKCLLGVTGTQLAEYLYGATVFGGCYLLQWGNLWK